MIIISMCIWRLDIWHFDAVITNLIRGEIRWWLNLRIQVIVMILALLFKKNVALFIIKWLLILLNS